jgi:hypothetical protein
MTLENTSLMLRLESVYRNIILAFVNGMPVTPTQDQAYVCIDWCHY